MSGEEQGRPGSRPGLLHVAVLGGYGLIGSAIVRRLIAEGHRVTGIGRSGAAARRGPGKDWRIFDIGTQSVEGWREALRGVDVVVNASGALQDGARDDLTAIHETALARIGEALAGSKTRIVQISASGVDAGASTEFFRSKARGEAALQSACPDAIILRPTLVLAPAAYGGTALLRAGAGLPWVLPRLLPEAQIQCVHVDDLAGAVVEAVEGRIAPGLVLDVTGADVVSLPELLRRTRDWLGFAEARAEVPVPRWLLRLLAAGADIAGHLGWRSPLRSTALAVLADDVRGEPHALPRPCRSLDAIFESLPATVQDRWFARLWTLFPLAVLILSGFWVASGVIGLAHQSAAADVLTSRGWDETIALWAVRIGGVIDIALGLLILWRPAVKAAALGMVAVSLAYIGAGTLSAPDLWADPLGPFVKVIPGIGLALFVLAVAEER